MRASCTAENLVRSPSVAGTNGGQLVDDLDEVNTDYAESDVMLGGAATSNSNNSNDHPCNGNSKLFISLTFFRPTYGYNCRITKC